MEDITQETLVYMKE